MLETHQRDGSKSAGWSHLKSRSHLVGLVSSYISDVVEVLHVEYLSEFVLAPEQPCSSTTVPP